VVATLFWFLAQAEGEGEPINDPEHLYPHWEELLVGALAFAVLFFFVWKWVLPRVGNLLDERRDRIQGELERAEETRRSAEQELEQYRRKLAEQSNRIIEEGRRSAEQVRADIQARAEREAAATVAKAQDEIRAERDRVFQELRTEVAEISVELAERVVGESLDGKAHQRLIDEYLDQVATSGNGKKG
jgi:F-type H+-transporting ATPase subunit b